MSLELILLAGNHDRQLQKLLKDLKRAEALHTEFPSGENIFLHGDRPATQPATRYIIGHEHPAISLGERNRREKQDPYCCRWESHKRNPQCHRLGYINAETDIKVTLWFGVIERIYRYLLGHLRRSGHLATRCGESLSVLLTMPSSSVDDFPIRSVISSHPV